jgi:hypothetical protein
VRKIAKVDTNQADIVKALRKAGASICFLHQLGKGVPDLLVGYHGKNFLLELKTEKGELTEDQVPWHDSWRGSVYVVYGMIDALKAIGAMG